MKEGDREREREKERRGEKKERQKKAACIHLERPVGGGSDSSQYTVTKENRRVKPVEFLARAIAHVSTACVVSQSYANVIARVCVYS